MIRKCYKCQIEKREHSHKESFFPCDNCLSLISSKNTVEAVSRFLNLPAEKAELVHNKLNK